MSTKEPSSLDLLAAQLATSAHLVQLMAQLQGRALSEDEALHQAEQAWSLARRRLGEPAPAEVEEPVQDDRPAPLLEEGTVLDERYRALEVVSRAGTDVTWMVEELPHGHKLLLTVLPDLRGERAREVERRLRRDVGVEARGDHPNVARVLDAGVHAGALYLVHEQIRGRPLRHRIMTRGGLPTNEAMEVLLQVASGLHAIHLAGVVHGDVRPDTVVIEEGKVKIVGFWPALLERYGRAHSRGSRRYAAPEQAPGAPLTPAMDIHALGVTAYEVLTGSLPRAPGASKPLPVGPRVSQAVGAVVLRAMAPEPSLRWPTAEAMGQALRSAWDPFGR